ncbi:MAG TPA: hypothetical protein DCM62_10165 [Bacteroidales bacterium]|nr:hypothetical protein [Bacteroidales bacterium]
MRKHLYRCCIIAKQLQNSCTQLAKSLIIGAKICKKPYYRC